MKEILNNELPLYRGLLSVDLTRIICYGLTQRRKGVTNVLLRVEIVAFAAGNKKLNR